MSWYEIVLHEGATFDRPGIYEWVIEGRGSYIGKFTRARRPRREYANNVAKIEEGRPYRLRNPDGFRRIHRELALARRDGRRVQLVCVMNCSPEELNEREAELIRLRGTLNGAHEVRGASVGKTGLRSCLIDPIPELFDAARYLDAAVSAHNAGRTSIADELIRMADISAVRDWSDSLWGKGGPWTRPLPVANPLPFIDRADRVPVRMPSRTETDALIFRDGYRCRFCGIPLVRAETRKRIRTAYPEALRWGPRNIDQHCGLQALWLQFDHVLPHARGGSNDPANMIVTCAPCNNGRSNLTLEEAGLADPRERPLLPILWDGLERFRLVRPYSEENGENV